METDSTQDILLEYQNDFNKSVHDFEKFAREVFNGSNENEKTKLHKKLEEFMTFKDHYKKKHDSEKLENILTQSRKRQIVSPAHLNSKKKKLDPLKLFELPNEIWLKIMSYLKTSDMFKRFNLVCKNFNSLSLDSRAIKHIEIREVENREHYHQAVSVLKRCKKLCEVDIYKCSYLMNFLSQTMKSSQGLRKLKLQSMSLSIKAFKNIEIWQGLQRLELIKMEIDYTTLLEVTKIKTLKSLKIRDCNYRYSTKGTKTTYIKHFSKALATNCNQFEELEIDDVDSIDLQEIATLKALKSFTFSHGSLDAKQIKVLANLHKLETITLNFYDNDHPKAASELNDLFQKHMSSLKNIKIGIRRVESTVQQISTTFLDNLILCENLETVSVGLSGFCNSDILKIFQLQSLKKLVLSGWYSLPRELRKNLTNNDLMANLEELQASCNVFRTSDPQVIFQLPKLKSLKLVDDPWVLTKNKRMVMNQMNCPLLERLFLPNFSSENPFNLDAFSCW